MSAAVVVGNALIMIVAGELWTFVALYHTLSRRDGTPWWTDVGGRLTMALASSEGMVLALSVLRALAGPTLDSPWFAVVRLVVFAALPVVDGACVYALWRIYHPRDRE